jgi:hypothetical protein
MLGVDLDRLERARADPPLRRRRRVGDPGSSETSSRPSRRQTTTCSTDGDSRTASSRSPSSAPPGPRRSEPSGVTTTFASESCNRLRYRGGGEAGEDGHLLRADVRTSVRDDRDLGRHRKEDRRDAVARLDRERDERLREARHALGKLPVGEAVALAVLRLPGRGRDLGRPLGPAMARSSRRG